MKETKPLEQRQEQETWTRDILKQMFIVITLAILVIVTGIITGYFQFIDTLPVFIFWTICGMAWWLAAHHHWYLARIIPPLICFFLASYGSYMGGIRTPLVLLYGLSIILAGFLINNRSSLMFVGGSIAAHFLLSLLHDRGWNPNLLAPSIVIFFCLLGISLVEWYFDAKFQQLLRERVKDAQALREEAQYRWEAESARREQAEQYRRLAENMTDMIMEVDPEGWVRYASPSYLTGLGYRPETLIGTNGYALIEPEDVPAIQAAAAQAAATGQPTRSVLRARHAEGKFIPIEISGIATYDEQRALNGFIISSRDISQQKSAEAALLETERRFRSIIEAAPYAILIYSLSPNGDLILSGYNPIAENILDVSLADALNHPADTSIPPLGEVGVLNQCRRAAEDGAPWDCSELSFPEFPNRFFEFHVFQASQNQAVVMFVEITERIQAAEKLRLSEEKFSKAFQISPDSININRLSDGVYIDINQGFTHIMGFTREDVLGRSSLDLNIWANPEDRARLVRGLQQTGEVTNLQAAFLRKNGETVIGLMSAKVIEINRERCILSVTRDIDERQKAADELQTAHQDLEQAYAATLQGWAKALELRERETANHSQRVINLTLLTAQAMGFSEESLGHLERGALLHDIGKLGVPDDILLAPRPLNQEEWAIMRQHPQFAYDLLVDIPYLRPSLNIPFCHHEHWDGSGYPRGLSGEGIPLEARIFSVVDVYDALLSTRPYRTAWSEREVQDYLKEQSGKQFDPQVVEVFLQVIEEKDRRSTQGRSSK